jgi:hypothetical protein
MKAVCGLFVFALGLLAAPSEAGGFKAPKPIDMLKVSGKSADVSNHGARHPQKYRQPEWGSLWKQTLRTSSLHIHPYVKGY